MELRNDNDPSSVKFSFSTIENIYSSTKPLELVEMKGRKVKILSTASFEERLR